MSDASLSLASLSIAPTSLAPTLPPELLDPIFQHASDIEEDPSKKAASLRNFSLVCRAWQGPAERLIFAHVALSNRYQLSALADCLSTNKEKGEQTRSMTIINAGSGKLWINRRLARTMKYFTNLTSLSFDLTPEADVKFFNALPPLDHLRILNIKLVQLTQAYSDTPTLSVFVSILHFTPNITNLSLTLYTLPMEKTWSYPPDSATYLAYFEHRLLHSFNLPYLVHLDLEGNYLYGYFEKSDLLTPETMKQIKTLSLKRRTADGIQRKVPECSPLGILSAMGSQLETLHLPELEDWKEGGATFLDACPNLRKLFIPVTCRPTFLPPTLEALNLKKPALNGVVGTQTGMETLKWYLDEGLFEGRPRPLQIRMAGGEIEGETVERCLQAGVSLVIDGLLYERFT